MIILPKSTDPPKLTRPYGSVLGLIVAAILIIMVIIHLFRIDTLIPIIDKILPGGQSWAAFIIALVVIIEVFAVPFALRLRLSPLGHLMSGAFIAFAPFSWLLISIWGVGNSNSTGELGQFVSTPSGVLLISLNIIWLIFTYITLWALGYNNLKIRQIFRSAAKV